MMQGRIGLCVSTQTPLARFKSSLGELYDKYGEVPDPLPLDMLAEGEDFVLAPGGVTRLLPPILKSLYEQGFIEKPHWISLNPMGPETALSEETILHSIELAPRASANYGRFKEAIWKNVHGVEQGLIPRESFSGYALYNWLTAKKMLELHSQFKFDLFYIHDFQLLQTGAMLGPTAPKIFRWHIPLDMDNMLPEWQDFILDYLNNYEAVIVSCEEYKKNLEKAGFDGKLHQLYPHIDPQEYSNPTPSRVSDFCSEYDIEEDDKVALVVARLDPMKGQNVAIKGMAQIARKHPDLKLVLVGNGSFSSSEKGGLGLPKGLRWKKELDSLASSLNIDDRVIFTGFISDEELEAAYTRSNLVILPSILEGFGLTVLEAWRYSKPVIVSSEAGVSELVNDKENSFIFNPEKPRELAEKMDYLLSNSERMKEIGERGNETVQDLYLDKAVENLREIMEEVLEK
ncbi:MAG: glycosyltransferase family 4 protein [Hadesarchaea archaeon]|nr:glycosyltransferase family 4 protein [Hadesarchaea archaeon]